MATNWGSPTGKKKEEFVTLSEDVQKILKAFKVTGDRFEMPAAELSAWQAKIQKLDYAAARQTAIELVAVEERFKTINKEGTVNARKQLASMADLLVKKLRAGKGWAKK